MIILNRSVNFVLQVLKRNRSSCDSSPGVNESNRDYALERNVEIKQAETSGNASGKGSLARLFYFILPIQFKEFES